MNSPSLAYLLIACFAYLNFNFIIFRWSGFFFCSISFFLNVYQNPPSIKGTCSKYEVSRLYCSIFKYLKEIILKNCVGFVFYFTIKNHLNTHFNTLQTENTFNFLVFFQINFGPVLACTFLLFCS